MKPLPVLGPTKSREAGGWTFRFVATGERLTEMVTLYRSLGFQVETEAALTDERGCDICLGDGAHRAIYTRRPEARPHSSEEGL